MMLTVLSAIVSPLCACLAVVFGRRARRYRLVAEDARRRAETAAAEVRRLTAPGPCIPRQRGRR